jgi:hypothetical protein
LHLHFGQPVADGGERGVFEVLAVCFFCWLVFGERFFGGWFGEVAGAFVSDGFFLGGWFGV